MPYKIQDAYSLGKGGIMKRWLVLAMTLLVAVGLLAGCGNDSSKGGKHLGVGLFWFGVTLDPTHEWDAWTLTRIGAGETLATVDKDMKFQPQLADSWENVDPLTWKFHIRENVKFQNGTVMTPDMVKASIERTIANSKRSKEALKLDSITVEGQNLIFKTTEPNAHLLADLTEPAFVIVNVGETKDMENAPILTGPYKIVKHTKQEEIQLGQFKEYWGGTPGLETVTVKNLEDHSKRAMALQSKDVDLIQKVDGSNRSLFETGDYNLLEVASVRAHMLQINMREGMPLADPKVREAVGLMIDYDALSKALGNGAVPGGAPFPPTANMGFDTLQHKQHKDLQKADALLKEAGYTKQGNVYVKDGKPLQLTLGTWGKDTVAYEKIQADLIEAGVAVEIKRVQGAEETLGTGGTAFDIGENNWVTLATNDPFRFLVSLFKTDAKNNRGGYSNPQVDALVDKMANTFDPAERKAITQNIQNILIQDNAAYFLYYPISSVATNKRVHNAQAFPIDYYLITKDITVD